VAAPRGVSWLKPLFAGPGMTGFIAGRANNSFRQITPPGAKKK